MKWVLQANFGRRRASVDMNSVSLAIMRTRRMKSLLLSLCGLVCPGLLAAQAAESDLKYFRSDHGLADAAVGALPSQFDAPGALRWRIPLDPGHSTPILSAGKIFLTAYHAESHELAVLALDEKTGRTLWRNGVSIPAGGTDASPGQPRHFAARGVQVMA